MTKEESNRISELKKKGDAITPEEQAELDALIAKATAEKQLKKDQARAKALQSLETRTEEEQAERDALLAKLPQDDEPAHAKKEKPAAVTPQVIRGEDVIASLREKGHQI